MGIVRRVVVVLVGVVALAFCQPSFALTNQPVVVADGTAPRKATVTWDVPDEVETDGKTITSWELGLSERIDFSGVATFSYAADVLEANLTRDNGLASIKKYYVRVRAVYADGTASNDGSTFFYTGIGKINQLRVQQDGLPVGSVILKWKKPARQGNLLTYNVRLFRKGKVVYKDSVYGKNNISVTGLKAGKRYQFKVRARNDSTYGISRWSNLKAFRVQS